MISIAYDAPVRASLTLFFSQPRPGEVVIRLLEGDPSGAAPLVWRGEHVFEPAQVEAELRALRRALRRAHLSPAPLAEHGRLLFDLLLPPSLKARLRATRGALRVIEEGIEIPWPLLHDGVDTLGQRWALGRLLSTETPLPPPAPAPQGARLLLIADPSGDLPAARVEGETLIRALSQGAQPLPCDLRLGPLSKQDFLRIFKGFSWVHFAGHASADGLHFAGARLNAEDLAPLLGGRAPRLVFANACHSHLSTLGPALLRMGVRHFIGTAVALPDLPGADFAARFYGVLRRGASVGEALRRAREGSAVSWAYALLGDPDTVYFPGTPQGLFEGLRRGVLWRTTRPVPEDERFAEVLDEGRASLYEALSAEGGRLLPGHPFQERALFGWPQRAASDARRAAMAALAVVAAAPSWAISLDVGDVISRGDEVLSPAFERLAPPPSPGVWVTPRFARSLGGAARVEGGRLLGWLEAGQRHRALVGRSYELRQLDALADRVRAESRRGIAFITGRAGMGKSLLVESFAARLEAPWRRFALGPWPRAEGLAAQIVSTALEQAGRARSLEGLDGFLARLDAISAPVNVLSIEALLEGGEAHDTLSELAPVFAATLGLRPPRADLSPGEIAVSTRLLLEALSREAPLCLVIEDVHALPLEDLAVLDAMLADPRGRYLALVTSRDAPREAVDLRLALASLSEAESLTLLGQLLDPPPPPEALDALIARAEGHPMFLRELALAQREGLDALPDTVEAVVQARVDAVAPPLRAALQAAALFGRDFWAEGVARLLQAEDTPARLEQLTTLGFLYPVAASALPSLSQLRFRHALTQELLYAGLDARARAAWHGRAALFFSEEVGAVVPWAQVATHWLASGDMARAAQASAEAARLASTPSARRVALLDALRADQAAMVFSQATRARLESDLAELLKAEGDFDEAIRLLDSALSRPVEGGARAEILRRRAEIDEQQGRRDQAAARLVEARQFADPRRDPEVWGYLRRDEAWLSYQAGRFDEAIARLEAAFEEVPQRQDALSGALHNLLGVAHYGRGDTAAARAEYERAAAAFERVGLSDRLASVFNNFALLSVRAGDFDAAVSWHQRALKIKAARGDRNGLARAYNNLGALYGERGDLERAAAFLREAIKIRARFGHSGLAISYANLGEVLFKQGDGGEARAYLERALGLCQAGAGPGYLMPDLLRMLAELSLAEGHPEAAEGARGPRRP